MKPVVTLYLLVNDEDYRLLHTHEDGLAEITHNPAELTEAGVIHVTAHSPRAAIERRDLAKHVSHILAAEWAKGAYDRIILSAGPKMLGDLRDAIPKSLHNHIVAELHKDLMKVPRHDLAPHFAEVTTV